MYWECEDGAHLQSGEEVLETQETLWVLKRGACGAARRSGREAGRIVERHASRKDPRFVNDREKRPKGDARQMSFDL